MTLWPQGKDPWYPLYRRLGEPQTGLDTEARGKILSPLLGNKPQSCSHPAHSQTLYWLSYVTHKCLDVVNVNGGTVDSVMFRMHVVNVWLLEIKTECATVKDAHNVPFIIMCASPVLSVLCS
jgi:hypothetical protein